MARPHIRREGPVTSSAAQTASRGKFNYSPVARILRNGRILHDNSAAECTTGRWRTTTRIGITVRLPPDYATGTRAVRSAGTKANAVPATAMTAALAVRKACAPTAAASGPARA